MSHPRRLEVTEETRDVAVVLWHLLVVLRGAFGRDRRVRRAVPRDQLAAGLLERLPGIAIAVACYFQSR